MQAPPLFEKEEVREKLRKLPGGPAQPLTVHLRQEIDRINSVILLTVTRLKDLRLAVAGARMCQPFALSDGVPLLWCSSLEWFETMHSGVNGHPLSTLNISKHV